MTLHNFSHFIQNWLFPPGLILLLMLCGYGLSFKWRRFGKAVMMFAFVLLWLVSTPFIAQQLIDGLQNQYAPLQIEQAVTAANQTAIVVLGSGIENAVEYDNKHMLSEHTLSRLHYAAYLNTKTHLPIIVSGGNRDNKAYTEARLMREVLRDTYKITAPWQEDASQNTEEESRLLVPIAAAHGIHTIYLVTHAWHMPRSMYAFKRAFQPAGLTVIPAPMGYLALKKSDNTLVNCLPALDALNASVYAIHEYIGLLWYRVVY